MNTQVTDELVARPERRQACARHAPAGPLRPVLHARRLTGSDADAADACQEALIAVVRNIGKFDSRSRFGTWAYRIAVNASLDELRRRKRRPRPDDATVEARTERANDRAGATSARRWSIGSRSTPQSPRCHRNFVPRSCSATSPGSTTPRSPKHSKYLLGRYEAALPAAAPPSPTTWGNRDGELKHRRRRLRRTNGASADDEFLSALLDGEPARGDAAHVDGCADCQPPPRSTPPRDAHPAGARGLSAAHVRGAAPSHVPCRPRMNQRPPPRARNCST